MVAVIGALMALSACGQASAPTAAPDPTSDAVSANDLPFADDAETGRFDLDLSETDLPPDLAAALDGRFAGQRVEIAGGWFLIDDAVETVLDSFGLRTGIDLRYRPTRNLESVIFDAAALGTLPSIVHTLQINTMRRLAEDGQIIPLPSDVVDLIDEEYVFSPDHYLRPDEVAYAVPWKVDAKSLVWYDRDRFAQAGYRVPESMGELNALVDQMLADGQAAPWCVGISADGATGYMVTDWLENYLLRMSGPAVYDDWVDHRIPFNAEPVVEALDAVGDTWYGDPRSVYGGGRGVLGLSVATGGDALFNDPPGCWMHMQSMWVNQLWSTKGFDTESIDFFVLPATARGPAPMLMAASFLGLTVDDPAARAVVQYLISVPGMEQFVRGGGFISPNAAVPREWYPPLERRVVDAVAQASAVRFDATDAVPIEVGTDAAWTELVGWAESEGSDSGAALAAIEAAWPD